jgi:hypothetical protein
VGTYWRSLTDASIVVYRQPNDEISGQWRLRIWKMPVPDFDSGWQAIPAGQGLLLDHHLIGEPSDFLVDMSFKDLATVGSGVSQRYFGGMVSSTNIYNGVMWNSFTTSPASAHINAYRFANDTVADQVRIRIWRVSQPDYESGYLSYSSTVLSRVVMHGLNKSPDQLWVDATAHQASGDHKNYYGRVDMGTGAPFLYAEDDRVGYYWHGLARDQVVVERMPEDRNTESINVRIWFIPSTVFIPMLRR